MSSSIAIMSVDEGEEIVSTLMSSHIAGTGYYKFLAKKRKDGKYEWAHFVQRDSGMKDSVYKGETENEEQLKLVIDIMNRNLTRIFGSPAEMKPGSPSFHNISGQKLKPGEA
jgi:hypothetical protein